MKERLYILNIFLGFSRLVQVRIQLDGLLKVAQGGIQSGDITRVSDLMIERQTQGIVDEGIFGVKSKRLLAGADRKIETLRHTLAVADAEPCQTAQVAPDIALRGVSFAAEPDQI